MPKTDAPTTLPHPTIEPATEEDLPEELLETAFLLPPDDELDTGDLIEAAEELLRQGAPHDFDVAIIGAGPGGLACALQLAQSNLKIVIIEAREIGGVCINRGCVPTKTLLESVAALRLARRASEFGVGISGEISVDFAQMQNRKRDVIEELRRDALRQLQDAGATILRGTARFVDEHTLEISGPDARQLTAVHVVIASGGLPCKLPLKGVSLPGVLTTDEALQLQSVPQSLIVIGGGAVAIEFATIFAGVGARVCILESESQILAGEDEEIGRAMRASLEGSGIEITSGAELQRIENGGDGLRVVFERDGQSETRTAALVVMAAERRANLDDLNLDAANVRHENGHIDADENHETSTSGVWAIGDCIRRIGWAHQAAHEGRRVADQIRGIESDEKLQFVPSCYYTFPEVATIGLTLEAAHDLGIEARAGKANFDANARAQIADESNGFVKIVVGIGTDKIVGAQIIGPRATELIGEIALAMRCNQSARALADAMHAHPTFSEILSEAARAALEI